MSRARVAADKAHPFIPLSNVLNLNLNTIDKLNVKFDTFPHGENLSRVGSEYRKEESPRALDKIREKLKNYFNNLNIIKHYA